MGKGSNSTTTNSSSSSYTRPDEAAYQQYQALLNRASGVASTPYQAYGGEEVAPINDQQRAGFGAINTAQGNITATGAPIGASDIQRYMDPYTQSVIDATQRDFDVQNARQQSQTTGNAAAQGALGGDRSAVAAALTAEGQSRSQAPILAGLRSQGYQQAVNTAENQQQQALRAGVAGLQGAQAMVGAGTLEQQTQQAKDTQDRMDYFQKQGYPFQVAQWLAQISTGVGSQMGGTSQTTGQATTQGPTPNPWTQAVGLGLSAASMLPSDRRVKENIQKIGETNDGQPIYRFNYKGSPTTEIGLMHDEVEESHPEATGRVAGVGVVDYRKATDGAVEKFRGGRMSGIHGYAGGGSPWGTDQTWIPQVGGIAAGRGAPQAPSLPQAPSAGKPSGGLSADQMKGVGVLGKSAKNWFSDPAYGGGNALTDEWGGSSASPAAGLTAEDYGVGFSSGGVARRGYAVGGGPDEDPTFDDRFVFPSRVAAGVGASRPAFAEEPFRMAPPEAVEAWRSGVDRDRGLGIAKPETEPNPTELPPEVLSGRSKPAIPASGEGDEGASEPLAYSQPPRRISGVGAPAASPDAVPDEGFLSKMGIRVTPEMKQGLLQAGLAMMATRHGGPGSFLQSAGEAGTAGVGAYSQSQQLAREQEEKLRKEGFEREKFEAPFSRLTEAQKETARHNKAIEAKEFKPTWGVIRKDIDPDTGFQKDVYGWIDPNTKTTTEPPGPKAAPSAAAPQTDAGAVDYVKNPPRIEKGADVPEPRGLAGKSPASLKSDAEYYVQTGKLPPVRAGQSPVAVMQQSYRNAVQNYGNAVAESRGINPTQMAEMWRTAPGQLRFVLGADGRATVSLGTAVRHLDTIQQLADAWGSGNVQMINKVKAAVAKQFGDSSVTNLESAASIVGPEIIKALGVAGAGTEHDRNTAAAQFAAARTPEQIKGAVRTVQALLGGQLEGKKRQAAAAGVTDQKFKELIGERPYEILSNADKGHAGGDQPKKGERKQFKQGWGTWDGSKWVPE